MSKFACPKHLLNGPCESVHVDGHCEVDQAHACVFANIGDPAIEMALDRKENWFFAPLDWSKSPFEGRKEPQQSSDPIRMPLPADLEMETSLRSGGIFEKRLREGAFVVTAEVVPPPSIDPTDFLSSISALKGWVDAIQVTDNWQASLQISGLLAAHLVEKMGIETILHMSCRDRNRNQLQADALGASAFGIKSILCLTGEHPRLGDHQEVRPVFDLDLVHWLHVLRHMREQGTFMSGRTLEVSPRIFIGAAIAPLAPPLDYRPYYLGKKVAAGADFVVTNPVFDLDQLDGFLGRVAELGLDKKVRLIVSTAQLSEPDTARHIQTKMPGVVVPESLIHRLDSVRPSARAREGRRMSAEFVQRLRSMPTVSGVNFITKLSDMPIHELPQFCEEIQLRQPSIEA